MSEEKKDKELTEEELEQAAGGKRMRKAPKGSLGEASGKPNEPSTGGGGPSIASVEPLPLPSRGGRGR